MVTNVPNSITFIIAYFDHYIQKSLALFIFPGIEPPSLSLSDSDDVYYKVYEDVCAEVCGFAELSDDKLKDADYEERK